MVRDYPGEKLFFLRSGSIPGAELLIAYGSRQPWHVYHETYAFCACRTAAAFYSYRRGIHGLRDGTIMLLEPGEVHRNTSVYKESDFKVLFVAPRILEDVARELGIAGPPHFRAASANDPRTHAAIYQLSAAMESGGTLLGQQSCFADLVLSLLDFAESRPKLGNGKREPHAIARARAYLQDRYDQEVSLDELAGVAGLSRFRLVHAFTREVGLSPHAYQIHVRIARARTLLGLGVPQAEIAVRLGFSDQSHFIRHFRRILRVTPGEYVRSAY